MEGGGDDKCAVFQSSLVFFAPLVDPLGRCQVVASLLYCIITPVKIFTEALLFIIYYYLLGIIYYLALNMNYHLLFVLYCMITPVKIFTMAIIF